MKKLLARLRRLWEFAGCPHDKPHCLHMPVQAPSGQVEIIHLHLCDRCGLCVHFEIMQPQRLGPGQPLNRYAQPAPGDERWN